MLTLAAYGLALLLGLFVKPGGDAAYLEIKGLRDASTGILGLALLAFAGAHAEAWFMVAAALLPLGDALIVLRHGGTRAAAFGIHFVTAAAVPVSAALLFLA
ncbi:DUF4267 domain-containing protein [Streptomyces sp. NPDC048231]|uniref:DUF4267 domain-containing protein n=1 Tax=Streptomyces sp. NPDC048231 TaxID=3365519 RepID=UPI0037165668